MEHQPSDTWPYHRGHPRLALRLAFRVRVRLLKSEYGSWFRTALLFSGLGLGSDLAKLDLRTSPVQRWVEGYCAAGGWVRAAEMTMGHTF